MKNLQDIMQLIEEEDVEFIRLQFTDVWGEIKNIAVTPGQMEKVASNKFSFEGEALFDALYDFDDPLYLVPDFDTFVILPWRPQRGRVGKLICDVCYEDGTLCEFSPRTILKNVIKKAEKEGYTFNVNTECEFFLFHTDENGNPTTITHEKAGYLEVGPSDFGENARRDMVLTLEEMGFDIVSSHHAKAPAQHEIDFSAGSSLEAADDFMTFKLAVRSIAKRFGLYATFMPKPLTGEYGSGLHLNFTMFKNGEEVKDKDNGEMSDDIRYFMGGVMAHGSGLCAITNPVVNSYKRITSGFSAPGKINWAYKGESTFIKVHKKTGAKRLEFRFPDTAANPYLAIASCIAAGMDGIKNKIEPPVENDPEAVKLPGTLNEASKQLMSDKVIKECIGEELAKIYRSVLKAEWKSYMAEVSNWEIDRYLIKM